MDQTERDSVRDGAKIQKISIRTILMWVFGIGILLMVAAYVNGYFTMGGPDGQQRMGAVNKQDTLINTPSDTIIGQ